MLLEDLLKDRVASLEALFSFLGVDPAVAASLEAKWRMRRQDEYAPMSEETKKRLDEHFRPYNEQLGQWLGRDLTHWG
jgi:hypothetical protein